MDAETKEVVKNIAQIQIEALTNIKNNITTTEPDLLRKLLQINDEEMLDSINHHIQIYEEIYEMPQLIKTLNEYQLYICSHILFKWKTNGYIIYPKEFTGYGNYYIEKPINFILNSH